MRNVIGRSTDPSTTRKREDVGGAEVASFRYNNPGAQYPSERAARFGQLGYGVIGGGHLIARFPSPVNGAAANFDLLAQKYVGMTIGAAGKTWTGSYGFGVPGYKSTEILTAALVQDIGSAIPFLKAIAGRESGKGSNLTEYQWRQAHQMFRAGSADAFLDALPPEPDVHQPAAGALSGAGMVARATEHIGDEYDFVVVPKDDPNWKGPWDCAEFVSWLVYQESQKLYGCVDNTATPAKADAFTGAWRRDVEKLGIRVSVEKAAATPGGILLKYPPPGPGKMGHIAICVGDGKGGTIEAKGRRYGVIRDTAHNRRWDAGILIEGFQYNGVEPAPLDAPGNVYALNMPNMDSGIIKSIQLALFSRGIDPSAIDGEYGRNTQAAVARFQRAEGLVVDGEVGPETAAALGVSLVADKMEVAEPASTDTAGAAITSSAEIQQLLPLLIMLLSKETPMGSDPAKQSQMVDLILPLLLQSALTGKQIDATQLLTLLVSGKPASLQLPGASPQLDAVPAPVAAPPAAAAKPDLLPLLLPVLFERLTGKAWPGTEQPKPDAPTTPQAPAVSRPSVQASAGALGVVTLLQALGLVPMPFNIQGGPASPDTAGTLATLIPIITGAIGATGGWGALGSVVAKLFGGLADPAKK